MGGLHSADHDQDTVPSDAETPIFPLELCPDQLRAVSLHAHSNCGYNAALDTFFDLPFLVNIL